jgi:hypothetical protein
MPLITQAPVGATTVVSAMINKQNTITVNAANVFTQPIATDQLPNLCIVLIERAAVAAPCTYQIQFALRSLDGGGATPSLDWLPLTPVQVGPTPTAIPLVLNFNMTCNFIRIDFRQNPAPLSHSIEFVIGAYSP